MHEYQETTLPLSTEQFRHSLNAGLGRARMHLDRHGLSPDLQKVVLASSLSCPVFDPQLEGLPAAWFADFCDVAGTVPELISKSPGDGHWDKAWRFALLAQFSRRRYPGAREALYNSLVETGSGDLFGAEDLVEVEGVDGLLYVARRLGAMWTTKAPLDPDDGPLVEFDTLHSEGAALALLKKAARSDGDVDTYLRVLSAQPPHSPAPRRTRATPQEMLETILGATESSPALTYRARDFTPDEVAPIRQLAFSTSNEVVLENCLRALGGCRSLSFDEGLVPFLAHPADGVRFFAARAISLHRSSVVAQLGSRFISDDLVVGLTLLRRSARPTDLEPVLTNLKRPRDSASAHEVVLALLNMMDDSSLPADPRLLLFVYEFSPCRMCRGFSVETLLEENQCPRWVMEEIRFDASEEIRELVNTESVTT